jgi:hypothetical protein|uniref:Uncharacterized protein n=1 Tax=Siphoviridae sp. ctDyb2 TaxID=2826201 RepID=A0A8S5MCJ2_9CAUD|nr:MAG TPA: hypothetical protein [Siphoviridae sp. ctDyb2]
MFAFIVELFVNHSYVPTLDLFGLGEDSFIVDQLIRASEVVFGLNSPRF